MNKEIEQIVQRTLEPLTHQIEHNLARLLQENLRESSGAFSTNSNNSVILQRLLVAQWQQLILSGNPIDDFDSLGFREYSQNNEDGILLYLQTLLGTRTKMAVEIGANCLESKLGFPQCNTANLVINHGWNSLILDGSDVSVGQLTHFFATHLNTKHFHWFERSSLEAGESYYYCPIVKQAFIEPHNINQILLDNNLSGEIDILSIDVDGMDYWLWEAITQVSPRIVVIEYNPRIGPELSTTARYVENYSVDLEQDNIADHIGTSLMALKRLGKRLGYELVGVNYTLINAFFVRQDLLCPGLSVKSVEEVFSSSRIRSIEFSDYSTAIPEMAVEISE